MENSILVLGVILLIILVIIVGYFITKGKKTHSNGYQQTKRINNGEIQEKKPITETLSKDLEREKKEIKALREAKDKIIEKFESEKTVNLSKIKELEAAIREKENVINKLEDRLFEFKKNLRRKDKEIKEKERIIEKLKSEISEIQTNLEKLEKELQQFREQKEKMKNIFNHIFEGKDFDTDENLKELIESLTKYIRENLLPLFLNDELYTSSGDKDKAEVEISEELRHYVENLKSLQEKPWLLNGPIICFAGRFSAGKSSVLNKLLDEDILPVATTPQTAIPTYITNIKMNGDSKGKIIAVNSIGKAKIIDAKILKWISKETFNENGIPVSVVLKHIIVPKNGEIFANKVIIDTPGIDPAQETETDKRLTKESISISNAIFWIVDINDGDIGREAKEYLKKQVKDKQKIFVIINKNDTKPPNQRNKVKQQIIKTLKKEQFDISEENILIFSAKENIGRSELIEKINNIETEEKNKLIEIIDNILNLVVDRKIKIGKEIDRLRTEINKYNQKIRNIKNLDTDLNSKQTNSEISKLKQANDEILKKIEEINEIREKLQNLLERKSSWWGLGSDYYKLSEDNWSKFSNYTKEISMKSKEIYSASLMLGKQIGKAIGKSAQDIGSMESKIDRLKALERELLDAKEKISDYKIKIQDLKLNSKTKIKSLKTKMEV